MGELDKKFIVDYFVNSLRKGKSTVDAFFMSKINIYIKNIIKMYMFGQITSKVKCIALNLQSNLSLQ